MSVNREFVGDPSVKHLEQPVGSNLCFATLMTGYVNGSLDIERTNATLVDEGISQEDGMTGPMMDTTLLPIENVTVTIDPILTPFGGVEDAKEIVATIDDVHRGGSPVALLYKKNISAADDSGHWVNLLGFREEDGNKQHVVLSDPLKRYQNWIDPDVLEEMVERSVASIGAYAYALSKAGVEAPVEPAEAAS